MSVFVVRYPVHKHTGCIEPDFVLFPSLIGEPVPPAKLNFMAKGNEDLTRRLYQYYLRHSHFTADSFTISPQALAILLSFVGIQAQTGTAF